MSESRSPRPPASVARGLARLVGRAHVSEAGVDRVAYSRDLWPKGMIWAGQGQGRVHPPDAVVWPGSTEEVSEVLRYAWRRKLPVVPFGAGSGVCGGGLPVGGGLVLDLKRLDGLHIDRRTFTVRAGAGCIGQHLEDALNRQDATLGHFPSSMYCSSVGGWVAARSAGQMSSKYGKIEDMVLGLEAVLADGRVVQIDGAAKGPGWLQLLVGNEGTLAVITEATLRIHPEPRRRIFRGFRFRGVGPGTDAIRRIFRSGLAPAAVRLYDEFDSLIARSYKDDDDGGGSSWLLPGPLKALMPELTRRTVKTVLGRPLVLNRAIDLLPADCLLIVGCEGEPFVAEAEMQAVLAVCRAAGGEDLGAGPGEHWYRHRYSVSYKQSKIFDAGAFVDTMEVATTWSNLMNMYQAVKKAVAPHAFIMAHFSHAYREGCSIYFSFASTAERGQTLEERYDRTWRAALGAVADSGATISHHHGVGYSKAGFMERELGGGLAAYQALKRALDPRGVLNPGKMGL